MRPSKRKKSKLGLRVEKKRGLAPGTLVHIGERRTDRVTMALVDYDGATLTERPLASPDEAVPLRTSATVSWIDVVGLHEVGVIERLGATFGIHPLVLEDVCNTDQRPKVELFDDSLYLTIKRFDRLDEAGGLSNEQVSIILGRGYVLSFQEQPGDVFEPVRARIRASRGRVRTSGSDYLAYALLDAVVDSYFGTLESLGDAIDDVEAALLEAPTDALMARIHGLKRMVLKLRKAVWPLREATATLIRGESTLFAEPTAPFLRDLHDHTVQVLETIDGYRDLLSGLLDLYMSTVSNRMNEVMKVLTIIATIFIPLTFIAGVYGMNFQHMPELAWPWAYPAVWGLMLLTVAGLVIYFKRKKWL